MAVTSHIALRTHDKANRPRFDPKIHESFRPEREVIGISLPVVSTESVPVELGTHDGDNMMILVARRHYLPASISPIGRCLIHTFNSLWVYMSNTMNSTNSIPASGCDPNGSKIWEAATENQMKSGTQGR